MTAPRIARSALVLSTTPPEPRDYGNRNRVFQTVSFLRQCGFSVSFLLYPLDEDWAKGIPHYYADLAEQFEYFSVIPNSRPLHRLAEGFHHHIDEWWEDTIGQQLQWLLQRKTFDVLFVNYTFFSKAFTYAPPSTLKILDTHDIFTGRREAFADFGVQPEFFYTNAEQEAVAFNRADAIIAIKSEEAKLIQGITDRQVVTIPYWDSEPIEAPAPRERPLPMFSHDRPLRLGFIGAENSVNVVNIGRFLRRFDRYVQLYDLPVEVIVAGNVCRGLDKDYPFLKKLGRVETIGEFYGQIDAVVAPLEFSTGIKIKVGEALAWRLPVLATHNAFDGFRSFHRTQSERSMAALCDDIAAVACNEIPFAELLMAARRAAHSAEKAQEKGFGALRAWMKARARRIVLVTDRPFWRRDTFIDEMIAQSVEYASQIGPVAVAVVGCKGVEPKRIYADVKYVELDDVEELSALIGEIQDSAEISAAFLFMAGDGRQVAGKIIERSGAASWNGEIASARAGRPAGLQFVAPGRKTIPASPLRYAPICWNNRRAEQNVTIFRPENPSDWQRLMHDHVANSCIAKGFESVSVDVPARAEFNPDFFRRSVVAPAERIVLLAIDEVSQLFVLQAAHYQNVRCLVIGESFVYPQAVGPDGASPSLALSLDRFLDDSHLGRVAGDHNSGWSKIWGEIDARLRRAR